MENEINNRIERVMSAVFEIPNDEIDDDFSPDNYASWDSLKHMNLVVALEEEFDIEFVDDEIVEMMNLSQIKKFVMEKLRE
jgi:acyl carrier protein